MKEKCNPRKKKHSSTGSTISRIYTDKNDSNQGAPSPGGKVFMADAAEILNRLTPSARGIFPAKYFYFSC
jgi:hypothetical protein